MFNVVFDKWAAVGVVTYPLFFMTPGWKVTLYDVTEINGSVVNTFEFYVLYVCVSRMYHLASKNATMLKTE